MAVTNFIKETRRELTKVTWPNRAEIVQMTSLVIVVSLAVGAYIGILDFSFSKLLAAILQ
jgi:preprotein translocase subunit SecE